MTEIYRLPDLAYDFAALEPHISGEIMELHHDKHHATYVKGANETLEKLSAARGSGDFTTISMLEKNLAFNLSGHILHSRFWENLSPDGGGRPDGELAAEIDRVFGGFDPFRQQMIQAAATIQGSGWAVAMWEPLSRRMMVQQVYDHQGNHGQASLPLLVIDAWEHAYYLQYRSDKKAFFEAIWNVVNWADVAEKFSVVRAADLAPVG
ncbi:MAG: superoxide dismutase [Acidimicrobiales bacterium]